MSGLMLGALNSGSEIQRKRDRQRIGKQKHRRYQSRKNIDFIILIGELDYYGQFGFETNANVYFSLNVRKEKILLKKLSEK
jgi:predicted N-acetyltransferase YhbS